MKTLSLFLAASVASLAASTPVAATTIQTDLHLFAGSTDGCAPASGLVAGTDGTFYGTTSSCGAANFGLVFRLTPPVAPAVAWTYEVLHDFAGGTTDGKYPSAGVVVDPAGNLYGSTDQGGANGYGLIYRLAPPATAGAAWRFKILHSFVAATEGRSPGGSLILDAAGNLYGTANQNGAGNGGTVFRLLAPAGARKTWVYRLLWSFNFSDCTGGCLPWGRLARDASGNLYGATQGGGRFGNGILYRLAPPAKGSTAWKFTRLHSFEDARDGHWPIGVILGKDGALYSTSTNASWDMWVYRLAPPIAAGKPWTQHLLAGFGGGNPNIRQVPAFDAKGNLWLTVPQTGTWGEGAVVRLRAGDWKSWIVYSFKGLAQSDGSLPSGELVIDASGTVYGTTQLGGTAPAGGLGWGTAWSVKP